MSSKTRETRMRQKAEAESAVEARVAKHKAADNSDQKMARDPVLRKLKANLKKVERRLKAIDASDALNEALAQKKAMPKEQPEAKGNAKAAKGKGKAKSKPKKSK
ncbi:MAG: hypothetical protein GY906_15185 [bacterium]|nr:hypothetical protein [bacterium]